MIDIKVEPLVQNMVRYANNALWKLKKYWFDKIYFIDAYINKKLDANFRNDNTPTSPTSVDKGSPKKMGQSFSDIGNNFENSIDKSHQKSIMKSDKFSLNKSNRANSSYKNIWLLYATKPSSLSNKLSMVRYLIFIKYNIDCKWVQINLSRKNTRNSKVWISCHYVTK